MHGKITLITGAGSGIGRATAVLAAKGGARVIVSDTNATNGEETVRLAQAAGGTAHFVQADVTSVHNVRALVDEAVALYGWLDIAINNAGVGGALALTHDQPEDVWDMIMDVNLKGVWLCMKYEIPAMLPTGGSIVNVASLAGLVGFPYGQIYAASKHGVIGLTKSAALEYARKGIRINAVCPGFTDTAMVQTMAEEAPKRLETSVATNPMRRLGTPDETAAAILFLCSDAASFINGVALSVDGGVAAM